MALVPLVVTYIFVLVHILAPANVLERAGGHSANCNKLVGSGPPFLASGPMYQSKNTSPQMSCAHAIYGCNFQPKV